jgi:hypothetical protein
MEVTVKSESRNTNGITHLAFIAECGDVHYEFDPLAEAVKKTGISDIGPESVELVKEKSLELSKTGIQRAESGVRLRYFMEQAENAAPEDVNALWDSICTTRQ